MGAELCQWVAHDSVAGVGPATDGHLMTINVRHYRQRWHNARDIQLNHCHLVRSGVHCMFGGNARDIDSGGNAA